MYYICGHHSCFFSSNKNYSWEWKPFMTCRCLWYNLYKIIWYFKNWSTEILFLTINMHTHLLPLQSDITRYLYLVHFNGVFKLFLLFATIKTIILLLQVEVSYQKQTRLIGIWMSCWQKIVFYSNFCFIFVSKSHIFQSSSDQCQENVIIKLLDF